MTVDLSPSRGQMLRRALRRNCPRCGSSAFVSWFELREHCEFCGLQFEREPGYWVGAVIINTIVIFATFLVTLSAMILITWPEPPWGVILSVTIAVNVIVPIVFYPLSRTVWSALELSWNPLEAEEINAAAARIKAS